MAAQPYRFRWMDYLRGFAILVIVFVHTRNGLINSGLIQDGPAFINYSRVITLSALPLFFFMSGMFVRSALRGGMAAFVGDKLCTIVYPYLLWSTIYFVVATIMASETNHPLRMADLWTVIYLPVVHYWFFYTLFSITMFYGIATRLGLGPTAILILSVGIYLMRIVPLAQTHVFGLDTLQDIYLPCFALGALINRGEPIISLSEASLRVLASLVIGGFLVSWVGVALGAAEHPMLAFPAMLPGAIALMSLSILMERLGWLRVVSYVGQHSLAIYVAHVFGVAAMRLLLYDGLGVQSLWVHFVLGIAAGTALSIVPLRLAEMAGFKYLYSLRGLQWRRLLPHRA